MKRSAPRKTQEPGRLRAEAESRVAGAGAAAAPELPAAALAHELRVHQIELEMQNEELRRTQVALETARDRYVDLYDFAPVGYLTLSAEGLITEANLTAATLLGIERARLAGSRFSRHVAPGDRDRWYLHVLAALQHGEPGRIELAMAGRDGRAFDGQIDSLRVSAPGASPTLRVILTDISERKRADAELRLAATAFETQEGMMITDSRGVIERVNLAFTQITGYSADEVVGRTPRMLQSGRHDAAFYTQMWDHLRRAGAWQGEVWSRRRSGEIFPEWLGITAVRDATGAVTRYVGTMMDISQRKQRDDEIARLAFYDTLTGLPNRRLLKDRLHQMIAVSARTQREGALLFIDLDDFKTVNDTFGHETGDLLLQQVARRLTGCVREGDTVARPGGDEFIVILAADLSDAPQEASTQARTVAEKILSALSRPYLIGGREFHGSASIGITLFSGHANAVDELLRNADHAMYQAKAAGRNTLRFFDTAAQQALRRRSALEGELRQAVQQGDFVLQYQPVVDDQQRLLGAEALVRWKHPRGDLVPPEEFISIAEETGLIHALGRWVLETACRQMALWAGDPVMRSLTLSVNVSARQFRDARFAQEVLEVLDRSGADAARLRLELTEGVMLDDVEDTIAKMNALKARGLGFSLDDFGTGYASLSYLKRLPLDQLKIDRAFIADVLINPSDAAIVRTIVALGQSLGLLIVAEGVETRAQRDFLAGVGCSVFQGDFFGEAAPEEALRARAHRPVPGGAPSEEEPS